MPLPPPAAKVELTPPPPEVFCGCGKNIRHHGMCVERAAKAKATREFNYGPRCEAAIVAKREAAPKPDCACGRPGGHLGYCSARAEVARAKNAEIARKNMALFGACRDTQPEAQEPPESPIPTTMIPESQTVTSGTPAVASDAIEVEPVIVRRLCSCGKPIRHIGACVGANTGKSGMEKKKENDALDSAFNAQFRRAAIVPHFPNAETIGAVIVAAARLTGSDPEKLLTDPTAHPARPLAFLALRDAFKNADVPALARCLNAAAPGALASELKAAARDRLTLGMNYRRILKTAKSYAAKQQRPKPSFFFGPAVSTLGDPPPGRSMLDRRNAGIVEVETDESVVHIEVNFDEALTAQA